MGDALFLDADGFDDFLVMLHFFRIGFVVFLFGDFQDIAILGAGIRMYRSLWYKSVRKRYANDAANEACAS